MTPCSKRVDNVVDTATLSCSGDLGRRTVLPFSSPCRDCRGFPKGKNCASADKYPVPREWTNTRSFVLLVRAATARTRPPHPMYRIFTLPTPPPLARVSAYTSVLTVHATDIAGTSVMPPPDRSGDREGRTASPSHAMLLESAIGSPRPYPSAFSPSSCQRDSFRIGRGVER
jgi:hypothetical protein